jgi:hypothetical protein
MSIEAKSEEEAIQKALANMKQGELPCIDTVQEA